jgi:phosphate starvation-inducible PhoH-like protein
MTKNNKVSELEKNQSKQVTADMISFKAQPLTKNIENVLNSYDEGKNIIVTGCAGTGKTFNALNKSIQEVLTGKEFDQIVIFRNVVPVRDIGHLPGTLEEKQMQYEHPYNQIINETFGTSGTFMYEKMKENGTIVFNTTSYNQGITIHNSLIIVDEAQNMTYPELYNIITRCGNNTRIYFSGDYKKQDMLKKKKSETSGLLDFINVIKSYASLSDMFEIHEMKTDDIVRGDGLCKAFIEADFEYIA